MSNQKEDYLNLGGESRDGEDLPSYSPSLPTDSEPATATPSSVLEEKARVAAVAASVGSATRNVPTVAAPFDFPSEENAAPAYTALSPSSSSSSSPRPVAIPQERPDPAAPFVRAYAPSLLAHGITADAWYSFVETMSAFLTAKVSDRAVSHAADMAREVGNVPKRFGAGVKAHAMSIGHGIKQRAKEGNIVGAAMGVVGGAISLPVGTALHAVGSVLSLPGTAVSAVAKKPQTPRERAEAYAGAANKKWFHRRGLHALLLNSTELEALVGDQRLVEMAQAGRSRVQGDAMDPRPQLAAIQGHVAPLDIQSPSELVLSPSSLWLVVVQDYTGEI